MNDPLLIGLIVALLLALAWMITVFNKLTRLNNQCRESWSNVDTELKRRYDLIPNLVTVVSAYARHERETLESVTQARNQAVASTGSPSSQARDENILVGALRQLFAVVEQDPNLKADRHFLELQQQLVDTEDRIQAARRFYNGNVRDFNTRLEIFPSNFVGRISGFEREDFFEIEQTEIRTAPQVDLS
jgi:LemA protein